MRGSNGVTGLSDQMSSILLKRSALSGVLEFYYQTNKANSNNV